MINYKVIIKNYLYIYGVGMVLLILVMFIGQNITAPRVGCPFWLQFAASRVIQALSHCVLVGPSGPKEEPTALFWT